MIFSNYLRWEWISFIRSPYKIIAVSLFLIAAVFAIRNGNALREKQLATLQGVDTEAKVMRESALEWIKADKKGPEDRAWVNIQTPFYAMWYANHHINKSPSPLMVFTIGQAEQFGFYKRVNVWSTAYDSDLAAEISNPERIALGALDFTFVILFLLPLLLIVLCFTVGGYEQDKLVSKLIRIQLGTQSPWIFGRILSIGIFVSSLLIAVIFAAAFATGIIGQSGSSLIIFIGVVLAYLWFWLLLIIGVLHLQLGQTSQAMALTMVWVIFALVIPGAVHQAASIKYPNNLMVDFLDAKREDPEEIYAKEFKEIWALVTQKFPEIKTSKLVNQPDSLLDPEVKIGLYRTEMSFHMAEISGKVEKGFDEKNAFIRNSYWYNPILGVQNYLFKLAETDYYSYQNYRKQIQTGNLELCKSLLLEEWNEAKIDVERFQMYEALLKK